MMQLGVVKVSLMIVHIYDGSHGCVNMIPGQAQKLYKSIKRDTDVIIKK